MSASPWDFFAGCAAGSRPWSSTLRSVAGDDSWLCRHREVSASTTTHPKSRFPADTPRYSIDSRQASGIGKSRSPHTSGPTAGCQNARIENNCLRAISANSRSGFGGLAERAVGLSPSELPAVDKEEHFTMHHCIQGWSGIAWWRGVPMKTLVELGQTEAVRRAVASTPLGRPLYGGVYCDTQSLENVLKHECLLASEMNTAPLTEECGAPLRLRREPIGTQDGQVD